MTPRCASASIPRPSPPATPTSSDAETKELLKAALITRYGSNDLVTVADTAVPVIGSMDL